MSLRRPACAEARCCSSELTPASSDCRLGGVLAREQLCALHVAVQRDARPRERAAALLGIHVRLAAEVLDGVEHGLVLAPQDLRNRRPGPSRRTAPASPWRSRSKVSIALLEIGQRLAGVRAAFQAVAQRCQLLGDQRRLPLQRAGDLQRREALLHLRREAEPRGQHAAHDDHQQRADARGPYARPALCAHRFHAGLSPKAVIPAA